MVGCSRGWSRASPVVAVDPGNRSSAGRWPGPRTGSGPPALASVMTRTPLPPSCPSAPGACDRLHHAQLHHEAAVVAREVLVATVAMEDGVAGGTPRAPRRGTAGPPRRGWWCAPLPACARPRSRAGASTAPPACGRPPASAGLVGGDASLAVGAVEVMMDRADLAHQGGLPGPTGVAIEFRRLGGRIAAAPMQPLQSVERLRARPSRPALSRSAQRRRHMRARRARRQSGCRPLRVRRRRRSDISVGESRANAPIGGPTQSVRGRDSAGTRRTRVRGRRATGAANPDHGSCDRPETPRCRDHRPTGSRPPS